MTPPDRLAELLDAHGADAARWPPRERDWMHAQLAARADASDLLARARALDAALDACRVPSPSMALRRAVLLAVAREPRATRGVAALLGALWRELGGSRIAGPAFALALALGLGLGWSQTPLADADADAEDVLALAQFDDIYPEDAP